MWALEADAAFPELLYDQLTEAYQRMANQCGVNEPSVAVRSSAVDEDGDEASFAGQHETYLNIAGLEAVADAVVRCWQSLRSERALEYRRQYDLSVDNICLAVLVQQMVVADVSSVVFSANPVTGSRNEVVINASWGLGESIVGGTVTPDIYRVQKTGLLVMERQVSDKGRMTVSIPGGSREVDVPRLLRSQSTLDDKKVVEMARLAISLEERMGWPVDLECAINGDHLYLLQCRPITTLTESE